VFPVNSPNISKIEIERESQNMRARLFYLRNLSGKAARIKEKRLSKDKLAMIEAAGASEIEEAPTMEVPAEEAPAAAAPETETKAE